MDSKNERLERLSEILRSWMEMKAPRQAIVDRKERFRSKNAEKKGRNELEYSISDISEFELDNDDY